MLGGRLQSIGAAMPIMNGYGLFVGLTTCAGELRISMSSSANILPDPGQLGDYMEQSFKELASAISKKPRPKSRKKAAAARKAGTKAKSAKQSRKRS